MWEFNKLNIDDLSSKYGIEASQFITQLKDEIEPYKKLVAGLFYEHSIFCSLYGTKQFAINGDSKLIDVISYILLLKQYELGNCAMDSLVTGNYMVCTTLIRSMFETQMFMVFLSKHPEHADDFVAFSEIIGNPDVDWKSHGVSRTKKEKLEKIFSIRKMIRALYSHTTDDQKRINTEHFYQKLCNVTHPSLEPSSIFYKSGNPPIREFSNIGIRRTITQLFSVINGVIECLLSSNTKDKELLTDCYRRRRHIYHLHDATTKWHKENPQALPPYTRNEQFRLGWKNGKAVITLVAKNA